MTGLFRRIELSLPYEDKYGLGQRKIAEIELASAEKALADAAPEAFTTGYINPEWQAMRRRQVVKAQAERDRAKAVLAAIEMEAVA